MVWVRVPHSADGFSFNTIEVISWSDPRSSVKELGLLPPSQYVWMSLSFALDATYVNVLEEAVIGLPIAILFPVGGVGGETDVCLVKMEGDRVSCPGWAELIVRRIYNTRER